MSSNDDHGWFDALSGKDGTGDSSPINRQAKALRRAIAEHERSAGMDDYDVDRGLKKLESRLAREGLTRRKSLWGRLLQWSERAGLRSGFETIAWPTPTFWGTAAAVILGIGLLFKIVGPFAPHEEQVIFRGGGDSTTLIVEDPEARATELAAGIRAAGVEPDVSRPEPRKVVIRARATPAVLDYLSSQRIKLKVEEADITLTLLASSRR